MTAEPQLDVVSLGRAMVELYAQQIGARLEDAASFASYLGGSSANIAVGCARLGLRVAMLSRVGDDHSGRFVVETLAAEGCDVSHVSVDGERPTALALLGVRDEAVPQMLYRDGCADMALDDGAVDEPFIAQSRALVITGTHFSTEATDRVSSLALERARRNGVRTVLDIDYCPALWGLTRSGAAANRHVTSSRVTAHLQSLLGRFDLVVGTRQEIQLAGGSEDLVQALGAIRGITPAPVVLKLGASGCVIIDGDVPERLEDALVVPGFFVDARNGPGAGDAFMAGLLQGWLTGQGWAESGRQANACGALVAARHGGSAAMPTPVEVESFIASMSGPPGARPARPGSDPQLARLHRATTRRRTWGDLCLVAIDERSEYFELARDAGAHEARLWQLKKLIVRAVTETERTRSLHGRVGALVDATYGEAVLTDTTGRGWWLARPVEVPGSSPLELEGGRSIGSRLISWPREQIVKCRVRFHPDDPVEHRLEQETQLTALYAAVVTSGHELLLQVTLPSSQPSDGDTIVRALKRLYNIGIHPDWWCLETMPVQTWHNVDDLIAARDPRCRGVIVVDGDDGGIAWTGAPGGDRFPANHALISAAAVSRSCCGFFVGLTALRTPSAAWLAGTIDDDALIARVRAVFEARVDAWQRVRRVEAT